MTLQKAWFSNAKWVWVLLPLTLVFCLLSFCRRVLYRLGLKSAYRCRAFVIVVGNISVGGNGKTPAVISIVKRLHDQGYSCGVLSRGYGGSQREFPCLVTSASSAQVVGDEPTLMAHRLPCPVVIDPKRARGAKFLADELGCDVIICDDGLQHYALQRDFEIVVMDNRLVGNSFLLPMGPLRESTKRLKSVDAIVFNTTNNIESLSAKLGLDTSLSCSQMLLQPTRWINVKSNELGDNLIAKNATALAGIGDPNRFFSTLKSMNIRVEKEIPFSDHHDYMKSDLPNGKVLMTEKDAVKVRNFAHDDCWYLEVEGLIDETLFILLKTRLDEFFNA
ncbi:tetraacyldisaccharide 4'-kinase [Glaciecola sp. MH2013]|uniref:tetraacyldisaccharide 4'-kinase n=1 Tax=Glaciecola sp. MH2013 TaxID=2785524 RepID=UPI0018A01DD1|nr:tetraacyldisaccharide 4'-kinase [Glaciecola sp. MH2013]MBF7072657.1 tetraacyldisaccharide 4'-kinase [Glaciecola sp. MH2013]